MGRASRSRWSIKDGEPGDPPELLLAGQAGKPHGLSGELYVTPISDHPGRFEPGAVLVGARGELLTVERSRGHHQRFLVKFEGVGDRTAAERMRGPLYVQPGDVRALEEGEWWEHELIGMKVEDPEGRELGRITGVVSRVAQDLLVVETPVGERLVPLVEAIVSDIDRDSRRAVVDAPPGLLD
ncbi:MAG TPA: ribosome maturation factor RimM [Actinomycetota bacterium]|nr:ribosome maturation factor RimM [Actinomycetota bacterium]